MEVAWVLNLQSPQYPYPDLSEFELACCPCKRVYSPYSEEINNHVPTERFLECIGLLPPNLVYSRIHLICKRNLLKIVFREQPYFVEHARKTMKRDAINIMGLDEISASSPSGGVRASREPEHADTITSCI